MLKRKAVYLVVSCLTALFISGQCLGSGPSDSNDPWLDDARLKAVLPEFESYAQKSMDDWHVPGMAIAIVQGDKIIYAQGFGVKKIGGKDPITPSTIFQIGSTTKAFTSALMAMMVDEGKVKWDDKVVDLLPEFQMYDPWVTREFTITDLMAQRSGLPERCGDDLVTLGYNRSQIMHSARHLKPVTSFRSAYAYQNMPFMWAGAVVEKLTNRSWEENIQGRIFRPLGMINSSTDMGSFQNAQDVAYLHYERDGVIIAAPMGWKYMDIPYVLGPAGSINSNVYDMAKWLILQTNNGIYQDKQLISPESIDYMHSPKTIISSTARGDGEYYCQGWQYSDRRPYPIVWHNGGTLGHSSTVAFEPRSRLGIVILYNSCIAPCDGLSNRFFDMYFGNPDRDYSAEGLVALKKLQEIFRDPEPLQSPYPALPLEKYIGNYSNEIYGPVSVEERNDTLVVVVGPRKMEIALVPRSRDTFLESIPDLPGIFCKNRFATFQLNSQGEVESLKMDMVMEFKHSGLSATFRRIM